MNMGSGYMENPMRQNFFRAGHAHAGVRVIPSLICQVIKPFLLGPPDLAKLILRLLGCVMYRVRDFAP